MYNIGLIGIGYWGPNIARSMDLTGRARIRWLCDLNEVRATALRDRYPQARITTKPQDVFKDPTVHAVAIATPVNSHFELAMQALRAGKHILVEKPITVNLDQAIRLARFAKETKRLLMVGHVFEYNATIRALKDILDSGEIGDVYYLSFERTNLGPVRTDVNALWDLATHDVSIMCDLLDCAPLTVTARGECYLNAGIEDVVFATFGFPNSVIAHVHASWLNPRKVRQLTVVGSKKMVVWDDLDLHAPIKIYDKRIEMPSLDEGHITDTFMAYKTACVDGGMSTPRVTLNQPLKAECEHFVECLDKGMQPRSDTYSGLRVVASLEAAMRSARHGSLLTPVVVPTQADLNLQTEPATARPSDAVRTHVATAGR
jgi:predicted dehydrogenase